MPSSAHVRFAVEAALAERAPSALTPQRRLLQPVISTGEPALDQLLRGGIPVGAISQVVGQECTGRTSTALDLLAGALQTGDRAAAWIDVSATFDAASAAAAGVPLQRLLWVRCGLLEAAAESLTERAPADDAIPAAASAPLSAGGCGSPHPRGEVRGMDRAVSSLLQSTKLGPRIQPGTPGAPNRTLTPVHSVPQHEQCASDRVPSRRRCMHTEHGDSTCPRCYASAAHPKRSGNGEKPMRKGDTSEMSRSSRAENAQDIGLHHASNSLPRMLPQHWRQANSKGSRVLPQRASSISPWQRLEQAIRVTDLLLQAGGFRVLVLDLASLLPEHVSRIPLATWFRFRTVAEQTGCALLVLSQYDCAKSAAALVLRTSAAQRCEADTTVFSGLNFTAERSRQRFEPTGNIVPMKKPSVRAEWWRGTQSTCSVQKDKA